MPLRLENDAPSAAIFDGRVLRSTPESGGCTGCSGAKRTKDSKIHLAVDPLCCLLALFVTPADVDERKVVFKLARRVKEATGESVGLAWGGPGIHG